MTHSLRDLRSLAKYIWIAIAALDHAYATTKSAANLETRKINNYKTIHYLSE